MPEESAADGAKSVQVEVVVMFRAQAIEGMESELNDLLLWVAYQSRLEEGCVTYKVHQEDSDPRQFIVLERWATKAEHDIHMLKPYVANFNEDASEMVETSRSDITSILPGSGKAVARAPGTLTML